MSKSNDYELSRQNPNCPFCDMPSKATNMAGSLGRFVREGCSSCGASWIWSPKKVMEIKEGLK